MGLGAQDEGPSGAIVRATTSYISKSRRNSSVEPDPQPPRHGDHRRRPRARRDSVARVGAGGRRAAAAVGPIRRCCSAALRYITVVAFTIAPVGPSSRAPSPMACPRVGG